jgi:hypothetical protein
LISFIDPQIAPLISASASVVSTALSICTVVLAVLVFREARRIRQVEWINTINSAWNDFNKIVLDKENHKEWTSFLAPDNRNFETFQFENRVNWILYTYLNILVTSMHAMRMKASRRDFLERTLVAEFEILFPRRSYVLEFFRCGGYDQFLTSCFENYCARVQFHIDRGIERRKAFEEVNASRWMKLPRRMR